MDFLPRHIQLYADQHTSPEPSVLTELSRETHIRVLYPQMLSGHLQGRLLAMLSRLIRPGFILEIGTFTGYSAICLCEGLREGGRMVTIDVNPELEIYVEKYLTRAGVRDRVEVIIGDARSVLQARQFSPDLVFLDADKESYLDYYRMLIPAMPSGGVILADNVLWSGRVTDPAVNDKETAGLRDFATFVSTDPRVETVLLPVRDGIMMVRKK